MTNNVYTLEDAVNTLNDFFNDTILTKYPYYKQINYGYLPDDDTLKQDMRSFIDEQRDICNEEEALIRSFTAEDLAHHIEHSEFYVSLRTIISYK
jgi:hypothetical protein